MMKLNELSKVILSYYETIKLEGLPNVIEDNPKVAK